MPRDLKITNPVLKESMMNSRLIPTLIRRADVEKEVELMLSGTPVGKIVSIINEGHDERYKITVTEVYRDVNVALRVWRERFIHNVDVLLATEMNRLEKLESAYWDAWENSKKPQTTTYNYDEVVDGIGDQDRTKTKTLHSDRQATTYGDPSFLAGVERVISLRYKLLGIGQTRTVNVNWRQEAVKAGIDPDNMIDAVVTQIVENAAKDENTNMLEEGNNGNERED